jgi:non-ribosomal peptide synthetase component F
MARQRDYLPSSTTLRDDRAVLKALIDLPGYAPHNQDHSVSALIEREVLLAQVELEVERARLTLDALRERQMRLAWDFHDNVGGAKDAVVGQYGADSQIVHAIGLKKKSERKRPTRSRMTATK